MPTPADLSAVSSAYERAKLGASQYTVTPYDPGEWNGGVRVGSKPGTYVAANLFKPVSPTGARNILQANVGGKDFWYVADPAIHGDASSWGYASVPTGASGTAFFNKDTWAKGTDLNLGSTRGRLFDVDPVADGVNWKGGPSPSVIKDVLTVLSPALIAIGGQALFAAGASGGVGASEGVSITAASAGGSGGVVGGSTGFTLAGSIPAYTAAQNAAGAAAAASTGWGSAGGLAITAGELAGGGAAVGGGVVASSLGTSSATWGSALTKTLGSVTSVAGALKAVQGANTSADNPLGLADASGGYYGTPYDAGTVSDTQLAPFVHVAPLGGVPMWVWAALAVGAVILAKKG